jgi:hypothetical protein
VDNDSVDGVAGGSARRKAEKLSKAKEERVNKAFGRFGKVANLIISESQTTKAWAKGAKGEALAAEVLEKLCQQRGYKVLHDRKIPKSSANIDHILVTDKGVFVVDAKFYEGLVEIRDLGGMFKTNEVLYVAGRKQSNLVAGVKKQVGIVSQALERDFAEVPVKGMLAFIYASWPLFFKPKEIDGVLINGKGMEEAVDRTALGEPIDTDKVFKVLMKLFPSK